MTRNGPLYDSIAQRSPLCVTLAAMFTLAAARICGAQDSLPSFIVSDTLRAACRFAATNQYERLQNQSPAARLGKFCALKRPTAGTLQPWADNTPPTVNDVVNAARGIKLADTGSTKAFRIGTTSALIGSTPLPDDGLMLVGFTQYVVGRAKEEATVYLINAFSRNLCSKKLDLEDSLVAQFSDQTATVSSFLPATCTLLGTSSATALLDAGVGLPSWGVVQTALRRDVDTLPEVVVGRMSIYGKRHYAGFVANPAVRAPAQRITALLGTTRLATTFIKKHDLPLAFGDATREMEVALWSMCLPLSAPPDAKCNIRWNEIPAAHAMLVGAATVAIVAPSELQAIVEGRATPDTALLYGLKSMLVNARGAADSSQSLARAAIASFVARYTQSEAGDQRIDIMRLFSYLASTTDSLAKVAGTVAEAVAEAGADKTKRTLAFAEGVADAATFLLPRIDPRADDAIADVARILERLARYPSLRASRRYGELVADVMTLAISVAPLSDAHQLDSISLPPAASRAIQFAFDASQVSDADGFAATLKGYAAPADAFLRKRSRNASNKKSLYWTLNAYVGIAAGVEGIRGSNAPGKNGLAAYTGLAIPAGVEGGYTSKCCGAFGLFGQIIDVGQVASWRSRQSDESSVKTTPPGLTLGSVFAPGAHAVWGIPRVPLTLGAGFAYAPQFRELTSSTDETRPRASVWRVTAFVSVDVPIFP